MPAPGKATVVTLVALVTFATGIAPANATPRTTYDAVAAAAIQPAQSQNLNANDNSIETKSLDTLLELTDYSEAPHNFDVEATIAQAKSEIGTSRATGWSAPGECVVSVGRWLDAGGADRSLAGGDPVANYNGAKRVSAESAKPGDVVQYEHLEFPTSWVTGVHTVLITEVNGDGTFTIIQSNVPYGSGLVTEVENWVPEPPAGFRASFWRF